MDIVDAAKLNIDLKNKREAYELTANKLTEEEYNTIVKPTIKDSGARREFGTGAVRDVADGKGRCDLLPLDIIGDFMGKPILKEIELFKETKNPDHLYTVLGTFASLFYDNDWRTMFLEVSKHYEDGAKKYSENNWKKGIPLHCYIDSGVRHYLKWLRSDNDESHDRAFVWNILGALWTLKHKPELDDIDTDIDKKDELVPTECWCCGHRGSFIKTDDKTFECPRYGKRCFIHTKNDKKSTYREAVDDLKPTEQDIAIVESFIRYNNGSTLPVEVMRAFFKIDYQIYKKLEERI